MFAIIPQFQFTITIHSLEHAKLVHISSLAAQSAPSIPQFNAQAAQPRLIWSMEPAPTVHQNARLAMRLLA